MKLLFCSLEMQRNTILEIFESVKIFLVTPAVSHKKRIKLVLLGLNIFDPLSISYFSIILISGCDLKDPGRKPCKNCIKFYFKSVC